MSRLGTWLFFCFRGDGVANEQVYLKIDGEVMPTPSTYEYVEADFDSPDSTRSETGILNRTRIRQGVLSPKFTWKGLTTEQLNTILNAVKPVWIEVEIFSPLATSDNHLEKFTGYAQATRKSTIIIPRENVSETVWSFECSFIQQ